MCRISVVVVVVTHDGIYGHTLGEVFLCVSNSHNLNDTKLREKNVRCEEHWELPYFGFLVAIVTSAVLFSIKPYINVTVIHKGNKRNS